MLKPILRAVAATTFVALTSTAYAYDLPGLNLGSTSFYDGSPAPAGPGWYLEEYLTYSTEESEKFRLDTLSAKLGDRKKAIRQMAEEIRSEGK